MTTQEKIIILDLLKIKFFIKKFLLIIKIAIKKEVQNTFGTYNKLLMLSKLKELE